MDRRKFVKSGMVAGTAMALAGRSWAGPLLQTGTSKPNIIIILCDDLGYGDLGCFGPTEIRTTNIDRLAGQGIKFTDFYSSAPVCSPSRAGLLTGRYPPRTGVTQVLFPSRGIESILNTRNILDGAAIALPKDELTVADLLKKSGYVTGMIGKWHLGDLPGTLPNDRGFDHYLGLLYSNDMAPLPLYRNRQVIEKSPVNQDYLTRKYTDEALQFLKENNHRPFFLYLAHTFPHEPLHASPEFRGKSKAGIYGDCVEEIDWSTGKILDALLSYGLLENTLVMFTSDNGPWWTGNPGYHRGRKNETFEGGMNVPLIASWPGRIPAGKESDQMAMNFDLFATCLAVAGADLPRDRIIDGKNLLPLLEGKEYETPHQHLFYYQGRNLQAARSGNWKYQLKHYVHYPPFGKGQGPWLFDLKNDPNESYNVIKDHPELAKEFEKIISDWNKHFSRGLKI